MLRITFSPPNTEPRVFEFESSLEENLKSREAELIERSGGGQWDTFGEWALIMTRGSYRALLVLLWVLLRRDDPNLELVALDDVPMGALTAEQFDDEPAAESEGKDEPGDSNTSSP